MRKTWRKRNSTGFTLVELLVIFVIVTLLAALIVMLSSQWIRRAKRAGSVANIRTLAVADTLYFGENGKLPMIDTLFPSTMTRARLEIISRYCDLPLPPGPVGSWPKRKDQPRWINDPIARDSGFAEGMTLGGGVYTGYIYVGGIDQSAMVLSGMATLLRPERAADIRNLRRGVIWAGILAEFKSSDPRRYECFHYNTLTAYKDFRFHASEVEGIPVAWSDGAVQWLSPAEIDLKRGAAKQIDHMLGSYFY